MQRTPGPGRVPGACPEEAATAPGNQEAAAWSGAPAFGDLLGCHVAEGRGWFCRALDCAGEGRLKPNEGRERAPRSE